jgi:hypothetical protein
MDTKSNGKILGIMCYVYNEAILPPGTICKCSVKNQFGQELKTL